jgi:hypothetical protein
LAPADLRPAANAKEAKNVTKTRPHQNPQAADLHDLMAQRFPLLPRTKPVCRALDVRVARVRELAHLADQRTGESLVRAGETFNLAALIMSDCGMPALAQTLCWQQFDVFASSRTYDAATAKLALQPLVNLGRLAIRDGHGTAAYQLLSKLFEAVTSQSDAVIDGRPVSFGELTGPGDDHHEVLRWLWSVLLADGTRALTRAGQWAQALQHAQQHKGIGRRLLDGRQVAILTHATAGDHEAAVSMLTSTDTSTLWEEAVAACMTVLCLRLAGQQADSAITTMVNSYLILEPAHEHAVFHTRLGLCALDLAADTSDVPQVAEVVVRHALESTDAYAAYAIVKASGLRQGTIPAEALDDLMESVGVSEASMADALATQTRDVWPRLGR